MQASQRSRWNHALEFAVDRASAAGVPLVAYFGLTNNYPHANARHYRFMLEGLREVREDLRRRGICFAVLRENPPDGAVELSRDAAIVVTDRGYLRHQRQWRDAAAGRVPCSLIEVESDVIVPVEQASEKEEYAARTLRPKIHRQLRKYFAPLRKRNLRRDSLGLKISSLDISDVDAVLAGMRLDASVSPVDVYAGGQNEAHRRLGIFLRRRLAKYDQARNDPAADGLSDMSPYLHFGQISPLEIALAVSGRGGASSKAYLEELIVRRELAVNFVTYNPRYDSFDALPHWGRRTLGSHRRDRRAYVYSMEEFERAATHDPYWNAAQREMVLTGKMHGYMRMYWGKKILEWSRSPQEAYRIAITLNDRYFLDGRDPNGYANVLWCLGKHDRPWAERKIFGTVRYMNAEGLRRKFDPEAYVAKVAAMELSRRKS
jgi:deoxyribodipyrimidine photo-lyase